MQTFDDDQWQLFAPPHERAVRAAEHIIATCQQFPRTLPPEKVTTIVSHDQHRHISKTRTVELPERSFNFDALARKLWSVATEKMFEEGEPGWGAYFALLERSAFNRAALSRMKALAKQPDARKFLLKMDCWNGSHFAKAMREKQQAEARAFRSEVMEIEQRQQSSPGSSDQLQQ